MNTKELSYIEIKAEVFRIIRLNQDKGPKAIGDDINTYLPHVDKEIILKIIKELSE